MRRKRASSSWYWMFRFLMNSFLFFVWFMEKGSTRCSRWHIFHHFKRSSACHDSSTEFARREVHSFAGQRRFLWRKSITRVSVGLIKIGNYNGIKLFIILISCSDDLRTANIISDSEEGVTCLVIDRDTFNQSISNLDEIRNKYNDECALERKR